MMISQIRSRNFFILVSIKWYALFFIKFPSLLTYKSDESNFRIGSLRSYRMQRFVSLEWSTRNITERTATSFHKIRFSYIATLSSFTTNRNIRSSTERNSSLQRSANSFLATQFPCLMAKWSAVMLKRAKDLLWSILNRPHFVRGVTVKKKNYF